MNALNATLEPVTADIATTAVECIAFVGDNQTFDVVDSVLRRQFDHALVRDGGGGQALEFLSGQPIPGLVVVDLGDGDAALPEMLTLTAAYGDQVHFIAIGEVNDVNLYRELTEAGVGDYLVKPVAERDLLHALTRATEAGDGGEAPVAAPQAQRIAVIGARGGVGATTIAVTLSGILAEKQGRRTALVDLDLEFGTVALALDLEPSHGLSEALENPARIDSLFISSAMARPTDRLSVLAAEESIETGIRFNPAAVGLLFDALGRDHDLIVCDVPRGQGEVRRKVLAEASRILLVTELTLAGLRDTLRLLDPLAQVAPAVPVTLIANRAGRKQDGLGQRDFERAAERKIDLVLAEDAKALRRAANTGKPLDQAARSSKLVAGLTRLATEIDAGEAGPAKPKRRRLGLFGGKGGDA